jgi:hypothetical protein
VECKQNSLKRAQHDIASNLPKGVFGRIDLLHEKSQMKQRLTTRYPPAMSFGEHAMSQQDMCDTQSQNGHRFTLLLSSKVTLGSGLGSGTHIFIVPWN